MKIFISFICIIVSILPLWSQETIDLTQALEIASQNSPEIRQAKLSLERSSQLLNAKHAALKSKFGLYLTPFLYSKARTFDTFNNRWNTNEFKQSSLRFYIEQPVKWSDGVLQLINHFSWQDSYSEFSYLQGEKPSKTFDNNLFLSFDQPIFTYNRNKLELKELELDLENTTLSYELQKLSLEKLVSEEFYHVYLMKMSRDISIEELTNRKQSYSIIKNKVDAGLAPLEELYQAELDLATSQSKVQNADVSLANALDNFKILIGISIFEEINVAVDITHTDVEIDQNKALDYGVNHRLELRQKEIAIENSLFEVIKTAATNEFKGNVKLSYGLIGTHEGFNHIYAEPEQNQEVSLSLEIPLWDWGAKKSQLKAAQATVDSRRLLHQDEKTQIIYNIRQAYRQVKNLMSQITIAQQNVKNAELTYQINLERYKNGDLTSMDLNLFENQLSEKKIGYIEALINYKLALLNLKIQSLWDFEKDRAVLNKEIFSKIK